MQVSALRASAKTTASHFDFGPESSVVKPGFIEVNAQDFYSEHSAFGLLSRGNQEFVENEMLEHDAMLGDGIKSEDSIAFRVNLPSGKYVVELFMAGGRLSRWRGAIRLNNQVIVDTIDQYGVSFESEEPPVFWSVLRTVEISDDKMLISVTAKDQNTTLCGISIYHSRPGPLILKDGRVEAVQELRAPNARLAIDLINKGAISEARRVIDPIPEEAFRFEKALLYLALAGRLELEDPRVLVELAANMLQAEADHNNRPQVALNLRLAQLYLEGDSFYKMAGWDWAREMTGVGIFGRLNLACHDFLKISQAANHPLSLQAIWNLGKAAFWAWVEQHDAWQKKRADECFALLKPYYPDHRLLKIYAGEQLLPLDAIPAVPVKQAPLWAKNANLALKNINSVIKYWVDYRQAENGEFGGKYDDDVEMLRWWPISRLVSNDETALLGLRRLVDGVWNSGWITNGFSTKVRDVEHSSEPVADTQPMMIGLDYGNPIYVERCMESIKGLRDVWTGVNSFGHRHFKSSWYSYNRIDTEPPKDCDVEMNTRTVKAARWLAWYNRHPFAMQFLKEWSDAWLEDCYRTDKGKPYGIVPAAIRYEDDAIGGHADNWHHPGMFWSYYNFRGGIRMLQQFLATFLLTGDARYLQPIELALKLAMKYDADAVTSAEMGSEAWVAGLLKKSDGFAEVAEKWRLITGHSNYDDFLLQRGSDYLKFRLTHDKDYLVKGCKEILDGILYNRELITTEGYFTDRIEIGNVNESKVLGASHLEALFTGSSLSEGFYPFYSVTWQGLGEDFAAAVMNADSHRVKILVYNLSDVESHGAVRFWTLAPGLYYYVQGPDKTDDDKIDKVFFKDEFVVRSRGAEHAVKLLPHQSQIIEVTRKHNGVIRLDLADLAVTKSELAFSQEGTEIDIMIPVHNIGIAAAENVTVELRTRGDDSATVLAKKFISKIEAPLDLEPRIMEIKFTLNESQISTGIIDIIVDAENRIPEITEMNNRITITLKM